jgi:hypothetical protein
VSAPVDWVPLTALLPDQAPEAVQEVALLAVQVRVALLPLVIALGPTLKLTVGAGEVTVTVVDCAVLPPAPEQVSVYVALAVSTPVECLPLTALLPDHAPEAVQLVALVADHVSVELLPLVIVLGLALSLTEGESEVTETVADCVALPPAPEQVNV